MWNNKNFLTLVWCVATIVIGEGAPIAMLVMNTMLRDADPLAQFKAYLGQSTAQLIAFGLLMAVIGDCCIERRSFSPLLQLRSTLILVVFATAECLRAFDRQVQNLALPDVPLMVFNAITSVSLLIAVVAFKREDFELSTKRNTELEELLRNHLKKPAQTGKGRGRK
jgi:hypothetical protein